MISKSALLLLATVVVGIYVLPSVTARFAGSHTVEVNMGAGAAGQGVGNLQCLQCHQNIQDEAEATSLSLGVLSAHNASDGGKAIVCAVCHTVNNNSATHTMVETVNCTDALCHGKSGIGASSSRATNASINLNNSADAHSGWSNALEASSVGKSATCLACHTHVEVTFNRTETVYELYMNFSINDTATELTDWSAYGNDTTETAITTTSTRWT